MKHPNQFTTSNVVFPPEVWEARILELQRRAQKRLPLFASDPGGKVVVKERVPFVLRICRRCSLAKALTCFRRRWKRLDWSCENVCRECQNQRKQDLRRERRKS